MAGVQNRTICSQMLCRGARASDANIRSARVGGARVCQVNGYSPDAEPLEKNMDSGKAFFSAISGEVEDIGRTVIGLREQLLIDENLESLGDKSKWKPE